MSTDDLAARRARHREARSGTLAYCNQCRQNWPCDAAVLGAALEAEILTRQRLENTLLAAEGDNLRADYALAQERQARQAAEAECQRLRELLQRADSRAMQAEAARDAYRRDYYRADDPR